MVNTTLTRKVSLAFAGISVALMSFAFTAGVANATNTATEISIPVDTIVRKIGVGNTKVLKTKNIDQKYQGMICSVEAGSKNQGSIHPGNNLVISSGNNSLTIEDVEGEAHITRTANGELTLANTVTVSLVMGQDNVFSAGMDVVLTCEEDPEIEVCRDGQIVPTTESKRLETDTDTCKEIEVCRDGEIVPITEDKKQPTDTAKCDEVTVCRDGKTITVTEDKVLDSDLEDNCPETLGTQTLPKTGAGAIASTMLGLTTVMTGAYGFIKSRR